MEKIHNYKLQVNWTGNRGTGTSAYRDYDRSHIITVDGKTDLPCSSDPAFLGDGTKYNPEELFLASLSSCHMLWFLHLCSDAGIIVNGYYDDATAIMKEEAGGGGHFVSATLNPVVTIKDKSQSEMANKLHDQAHRKCFIANSCNFPVLHKPKCI
jgi:organic hydroperoxide reductase OsmC/OhrA